MIISFDDDFNIRRIANSGQCFRFIEKENEIFENTALGHVLRMRQTGEAKVDFDCDSAEFDNFWRSYFDLDTNYSDIRKKAANDPFLNYCCSNGVGIRILKQDSWETFISFIISQRKSIPAIKTSIERLSRACGAKLSENSHAFPTSEAILSCDPSLLESCGLGYRLPYIIEAAESYANGSFSVPRLNSLSDEKLFEELKKYNGVGDKVASCTALFGFHRLDFFPKDVWIKRALENKYPQGFDFDLYAPYNGVIQQYIFFSYRPGLTDK